MRAYTLDILYIHTYLSCFSVCGCEKIILPFSFCNRCLPYSLVGWCCSRCLKSCLPQRPLSSLSKWKSTSWQWSHVPAETGGLLGFLFFFRMVGHLDDKTPGFWVSSHPFCVYSTYIDWLVVGVATLMLLSFMYQFGEEYSINLMVYEITRLRTHEIPYFPGFQGWLKQTSTRLRRSNTSKLGCHWLRTPLHLGPDSAWKKVRKSQSHHEIFYL